MKSRGKNIWKIKKGSPLPVGIKLVQDRTNRGHFMLAPEHNMPYKLFLGLLEKLASDPHVSVKLTVQEISNAR